MAGADLKTDDGAAARGTIAGPENAEIAAASEAPPLRFGEGEGAGLGAGSVVARVRVPAYSASLRSTFRCGAQANAYERTAPFLIHLYS